MSNSVQDINISFIEPLFSQDNSRVRAFFVLKNDTYKHSMSAIEGLNFGISFDNPIYRENILFLKKHLRLDDVDIATAKQIHGNNFVCVDKGGHYDSCDAFITTTPSCMLTIRVADCAVIYLYDPTTSTIGLVHSGWRGCLNGVLEHTLEQMKIQQCNFDYMQCFVSPCISSKYFEVSHHIAMKFPSYARNKRNNKWYVNLKKHINHILKSYHIWQEHIEINDLCTYESLMCYSYRREGEMSGRMLAGIYLKS